MWRYNFFLFICSRNAVKRSIGGLWYEQICPSARPSICLSVTLYHDYFHRWFTVLYPDRSEQIRRYRSAFESSILLSLKWVPQDVPASTGSMLTDWQNVFIYKMHKRFIWPVQSNHRRHVYYLEMALLYLSRQGLAIRDHDESGLSSHRGNLIELRLVHGWILVMQLL